MQISTKKKQSIFPIVLILLLGITITGVLAFLTDRESPVLNTFVPTEVTCSVEEDFFDKNVKKDVSVKNTCDIDVYIRAAIIVNWVDKDGNILGAVDESDILLDIYEDKGWVKGSDGYYYYGTKVSKDASTNHLIKECRLADGTVATEGHYLSVEIIADAIQSSPDIAVDVWDNEYVNVTGNTGNLSIANK